MLALIKAVEQVRARVCWLFQHGEYTVDLALCIHLYMCVQIQEASMYYTWKIFPELDLPFKLKTSNLKGEFDKNKLS